MSGARFEKTGCVFAGVGGGFLHGDQVRLTSLCPSERGRDEAHEGQGKQGTSDEGGEQTWFESIVRRCHTWGRVLLVW